ncbi:DUF2332 domain-containing protein [Paenibacillus lycopersici]|nr:DUF2332 domain-containing protein [Paenibacillus lycopersici]
MQALSELFHRYAVRYFRDSSPLYEALSLRIAKDAELLALAAQARAGQPQPNMLFGAVHDVLLQGARHPLRRFYPSLVDDPGEPALAFEPFRSFCAAYRREIVALLKSKRVQTNEVNRCAYLYPAFCHVYRHSGKPLALIEIGTSAGLQLLWDRYGYSYGADGAAYGCASAALRLESEPLGDNKPDLLLESPPVASRTGIDLHVNDLNDEADLRWLNALIWPEHRERRMRLTTAAACLKRTPVRLIEGDAIELIADVAAEAPAEATLCIFHTHVANQFTAEAKQALRARLRELGRKRDYYHLYNNMDDLDLHLDAYLDGELHPTKIAETEGHGRWFRWLM